MDWLEELFKTCHFTMSCLLCIELSKTLIYIELRNLNRIKKISFVLTKRLPISTFTFLNILG